MQKNSWLLLLLLPLIFTTIISTAYATSEEILVIARTTSNTYSAGEFPIIIGVVKDHQGNALENIEVSASILSHDVSTITNNVGSYILKSPISAQVGQYAVNVMVSKDGSASIASTSFKVEEKSSLITKIPNEIQSAVETTPKSIESTLTVMEEGITKNPVSDTIRQQMESQKKFAEQEYEKFKYIQFLNEQRRLAQESLEKDLNSIDKKYELNSARNAFAGFVADVDSTMQDFFWAQFALTERLTKEGHDAKLEALKDGQTPREAMNVFHRKAAITHQELVEFNNELNIEYGFADQNSQNIFDENGKLSREE